MHRQAVVVDKMVGMSQELTTADRIKYFVLQGWTAPEIARRLAPDNKKRQKQIRNQVRKVISRDELLGRASAEIGQGAMIETWPDVVDAVIKRALRGRVDAAKFIGEVSGIYNPKIRHEHTGDITVHLAGSGSVPRPSRPNDVSPVVDADVIEE